LGTPVKKEEKGKKQYQKNHNIHPSRHPGNGDEDLGGQAVGKKIVFWWRYRNERERHHNASTSLHHPIRELVYERGKGEGGAQESSASFAFYQD